MARSLLLDRTKWDLVLDASGNIAVADEPYSLAQDAASAIRLFLGECWYDTTLGIPYFEQILGQYPSVEFMRAEFVAAALGVPDVTAASVFLTGLVRRQLTGQVQVTGPDGVVSTAGF